MELQSLTIARAPAYASENAGQWVAQVEYKSPREQSSILLADGVAVELLSLVGPIVAKRAAEAAGQAAGLIEQAVKEAQGKLLPAINISSTEVS